MTSPSGTSPSVQKSIQEIVADPGAYYRRPADVLNDSNLTEKVKVEILKQWANDARAQMRATGEGMPDGPSHFQECVDALCKLGHSYLEEVQNQPATPTTNS